MPARTARPLTTWAGPLAGGSLPITAGRSRLPEPERPVGPSIAEQSQVSSQPVAQIQWHRTGGRGSENDGAAVHYPAEGLDGGRVVLAGRVQPEPLHRLRGAARV